MFFTVGIIIFLDKCMILSNDVADRVRVCAYFDYFNVV